MIKKKDILGRNGNNSIQVSANKTELWEVKTIGLFLCVSLIKCSVLKRSEVVVFFRIGKSHAHGHSQLPKHPNPNLPTTEQAKSNILGEK